MCDSWETRAFRGRGRGRTTWSPTGSERSVAVEAMVAAGSAGSGSVRPLPQAPRVCLCLLAWVDAAESISTAFLVRVLWFAGVCGRRKTVANTSECDRGRRDGEGGIQSGSNRRIAQRPTNLTKSRKPRPSGDAGLRGQVIGHAFWQAPTVQQWFIGSDGFPFSSLRLTNGASDVTATVRARDFIRQLRRHLQHTLACTLARPSQQAGSGKGCCRVEAGSGVVCRG